jgi:hypothetical protein
MIIILSSSMTKDRRGEMSATDYGITLAVDSMYLKHLRYIKIGFIRTGNSIRTKKSERMREE